MGKEKSGPPAKVKVGEVYGHLRVLEIMGSDPMKKNPRRRAFCLCDCGKTTTVALDHLRGGRIKSCGCLMGRRNSNKIVNRGEYSEIIINSGETILVDSEDVDRLASFTWHVSGGGAEAQMSGKAVLMHRLLLNFPDSIIDHKNRNRFDNRKENLRLATYTKNRANSIAIRGYKGVQKTGGKWVASICKNYQEKYLGTFNSPIEAALAYDTAARVMFGEFARTNFGGESEATVRGGPTISKSKGGNDGGD